MPVSLRVLQPEYTFDHRLANCEACSILPMREKSETLSQWPAEFNGLAIVGEGPGRTEAEFRVPFIGPSGKLLDRLLKQAGIEREHCWVGNATACQPPKMSEGEKKGLMERHPDAVHACRSRLLTELTYVKPRVILALGRAALGSLTGEEAIHNKRVANPCSSCSDVRSWRVWGCAKCKHAFMMQPAAKDEAPPPGSPCDQSPEGCKKDPKKPGKYQPRTVTCGSCGGHKTRVESLKTFASEHSLAFVAGGIFRASNLQIGKYLENPESIYVVPTFHPAALLRKAAKSASDKQQGGQFLASAVFLHLQKVKRLLESDPVWAAPWQRIDEPISILRWAEQAKASGQTVSFDIETEADKDGDATNIYEVSNITCIGFATAQHDVPAMVVDTDGLPPDHPRVRAVIQILEDPQIPKVPHNGLYDTGVIDRIWDAWVASWVDDTLLLHHAVAPDESHKLHHVAFTYTDSPPWKPPRKKEDKLRFETKEELHEYNARDCKVTAFATVGLRRQVEEENVRFLADLDLKKFKMAFAMRKFGMPVDRRKMLEVVAEAQYREEAALAAMRKMVGQVPFDIQAERTGRDFNPFAIKQLQWALYAHDGPFKLVCSKFTDPSAQFPRGQPSTDASALLDHVGHPFVVQLREFREYKRIHDTYSTGMPIGVDGRIHAEWKPIKVSGRWGSSPNMQNWPEWARGMVAAPEGRAFVGADKSQLEMRVIAITSGDTELIRRCIGANEDRKLEPEHDPHSWITANFFGEAFLQLSLKDPKHDKGNDRCKCETCTRKALRTAIKTAFYALSYGSQAETVHEALYSRGGYNGPPLTVRDVARIIETIFKLLPAFKRYRDELISSARKTGITLDLLLNRRRIYPLKEPDETVVYNFPCQSTAASTVDMELWNIFCELPNVDPTAGVMAQVHDAIYIECDEERAVQVAQLVEHHMNTRIRSAYNEMWMPLPATAKIAYSWKDA